MSTRIFFAGILGGIVMFIWNWIGHDVLPLGRTGVSELPNQQTIRDALAANLTADGFYLFPMPKLDPNATGKEKRAAMEQAMKEIASGPSGLLVYHPTRQFAFRKLLAIEFSAEVIEALLIAWLLAQTGIASFAGRVGFVIVAGILAAMATNVSYWNFYGFPGAYTRCLYVDPARRIYLRWNCRGDSLTKISGDSLTHSLNNRVRHSFSMRDAFTEFEHEGWERA